MGYTIKNLKIKLDALLELNELYKNCNLNINTFYPYFNTPNLLRGLDSDYAYLKNSKNIDFNKPEIVDLINNLPEICKMIREYTTGINLENLKYRKSIEDILERNRYLENYMYAEYIIKAYITDKQSYKTVEFLKKYGINDEILKYCVSLIQFMNPALYKEYLDKYDINNQERKEALFHEFYNLAKCIEDCEKKGEELSLVDFFRLTPFKEYGPIYIDKVNGFLKHGYTLSKVSNYIYSHDIQRFKYMFVEQEKRVTRILDGHKLTPEDNENIIKIMDVYGIPYVKKLYRIITDEYIAGKYDMDEILEKYKRLEDVETIHVPYQYVKVSNSSNK